MFLLINLYYLADIFQIYTLNIFYIIKTYVYKLKSWMYGYIFQQFKINITNIHLSIYESSYTHVNNEIYHDKIDYIILLNISIVL